MYQFLLSLIFMSTYFFKTNILTLYIGKYSIIVLNNNDYMDNFLIIDFIKEDNYQPYTGNLFLKHKYDNQCTYTILTENIKEIYIYDDINYDKNILYLIILILKKKLNNDILRYMYKFLRNGHFQIFNKK